MGGRIMRHSIRHAFTMVETMLALAVTAIGICSITALFPIGATANMDAAMETYCGNAADELLHYFKYHIADLELGNKWNEYIKNATGNELLKEVNSAAEVDALFGTIKLDAADISKWHSAPLDDFPNIVQRNDGYEGVFLLYNLAGEDAWSSSVDVASINWAAIIVVTKTHLKINGSNVNYDYGVRLQADVSWPAAAPIAKRKRATYVLDVFKNN